LSVHLWAQEPDSTVYRFGLPVSNDDTTGQFLQDDQIPRDEWKAIPLDDLPAEVLEAITEENQYKGWRDSTVYFEKNTGHYLVPVDEEDGLRIYGLNEDGEPVTFDIIDEPRD
jgi:hypothetical protein